MQWFLDLSVRAKCSVAMGLMVVLLGVVIFTGYRSIKTIQQSQARLFEIEFGTKQAETAAHSLYELGQKLKQLVEQYRV